MNGTKPVMLQLMQDGLSIKWLTGMMRDDELPYKVVKRDQNGELHCTDGPAVVIATSGDDQKFYFIHGVMVPEKIVMTPAEDLNPLLVVEERNAQIRSVIFQKIGAARCYKKFRSRLLDVWNDYELWELNLTGLYTEVPQGSTFVRGATGMEIVATSTQMVSTGRRPHFLRMKNPSTGQEHFECVPNTIETCQEALAWRDGDEEGYVEPHRLT